ncbi:MAG: response regulator [Candidatus Zixiibacteriota bacterium]|nr:MAG: response regulator [candidate division Zixibacteria bacterium]
MAIVTIYSGSFCHGDEVARGVAERLQYGRMEEKLIAETARRFGASPERLLKIMSGPSPFFNKFTREREKLVAQLKVILAELILPDNQLLYGPAGHLLPRTIAHVFKVCVIANHVYRVSELVRKGAKSEKEAHKIVHRDDQERLEWVRYLFGKTPYDESLYDVVIPMHNTPAEDAVKIICDHTVREQVRTTERSRRAAEDFVLAATVNLAMVEAGHDVDVSSENGLVILAISQDVVRMKQYQDELRRIALKVSGVKDVQTRIGPKFRAASVIPWSNIEVPPKILLVDDEKEFVHTLSERLQTRNLESSVVYDGEQALDFVKKDEPDVMVLDLMMPGIDGIEVLRRVKSEHPDVEIIILTGHGSEREKALATELGAFAYLQKPVSIDVLAQVMKEAYQRVNKAKTSGHGGPGTGNTVD